MLSPIFAIIGGLIVAAPLVLASQPWLKEFLAKVAPYEEWIGVYLTIFGLLSLLGALTGAGGFGLKWAFIAVYGIVRLLVGFLLAYRLIVKHVLSKNKTARVRGQEFRARLSYYQIYLGLALIVLAVISLVY